MKTFFNVLYRKILYKIPLKFLLILLAVVAVFMACFSSAANITLYDGLNDSYNSTNVFINPLYNTNTEDIYLLCITNNSSSILQIWQGAHEIRMDHGDFPPFCLGVNNTLQDLSVIVYGNQSYSAYNVSYIKASNFNSLNCQTEYNLIPISSVDQSYCVNNNLCPSGGTPSDCPNVGVSNVFINDIFHPGAFNVIINIPEEIDWDYAYTNSGSNINIDVVGYNVDYTKVQEVIDLQNYKPSEEDFTQIIGLLAPYTKIIVFFVFLFLVWAWIKKPFKSKKL